MPAISFGHIVARLDVFTAFNPFEKLLVVMFLLHSLVFIYIRQIYFQQQLSEMRVVIPETNLCQIKKPLAGLHSICVKTAQATFGPDSASPWLFCSANVQLSVTVVSSHTLPDLRNTCTERP